MRCGGEDVTNVGLTIIEKEEKYPDMHADSQTDRQTNTHIHRDKQTDRQTDR